MRFSIWIVFKSARSESGGGRTLPLLREGGGEADSCIGQRGIRTPAEGALASSSQSEAERSCGGRNATLARAMSAISSRGRCLDCNTRSVARTPIRQMLVHSDHFSHQCARAPFFRIERAGRGERGAFLG